MTDVELVAALGWLPCERSEDGYYCQRHEARLAVLGALVLFLWWTGEPHCSCGAVRLAPNTATELGGRKHTRTRCGSCDTHGRWTDA